MRLGIFGGSFDPVHYGHLLAAESCREQANLDDVWFVPLAVPAHKSPQDISAASDRIDMLKLAAAGHQSLRVSSLEIDRGGISYTVETLEQLHGDQPDNELFLILGADSLADFPTWRNAERICELAALLVVRREGYPEPNFRVLAEFVDRKRIEHFKSLQVEMPAIGLAAREIRHRVASGRSIRYRTPRAVERYIETHGLYRRDPS
ncbi:MAG: nicotinate-nucleotide adenylyltransferase [Planctomycetota bacterium]|nr:nicotinate-nucleotide adenylyltransferase [Planctomycetota bacterium]